MKAPQIIYIIIVIIGLMIASYNHGKPKTGKYNLWDNIIAIALHIGLLYWGGFFN